MIKANSPPHEAGIHFCAFLMQEFLNVNPCFKKIISKTNTTVMLANTLGVWASSFVDMNQKLLLVCVHWQNAFTVIFKYHLLSPRLWALPLRSWFSLAAHSCLHSTLIQSRLFRCRLFLNVALFLSYLRTQKCWDLFFSFFLSRWDFNFQYVYILPRKSALYQVTHGLVLKPFFCCYANWLVPATVTQQVVFIISFLSYSYCKEDENVFIFTGLLL